VIDDREVVVGARETWVELLSFQKGFARRLGIAGVELGDPEVVVVGRTLRVGIQRAPRRGLGSREVVAA
jgi:hypothetical protein